VNPKSWRPEESDLDHERFTVKDVETSKAAHVLAGVPVIPLVVEHAVGAQNLRKAAAARKGCRSRSGYTL